MKKNHYIPHEWNVTCDVCSKKIKASDAKQRWDGFIVCPDDFETRHPQDFIQTRQDKMTVPFSRPNYNPDYYVCTLEQCVAIAGIGVAGCSVAAKQYAYEK